MPLDLSRPITTAEDDRLARRYAAGAPADFWAEVAGALAWDAPYAYPRAGALDLTHNALDRHRAAQSGALAFIWEPNEPGRSRLDGNPGGTRHISYAELHAAVCRAANALAALGVGRGVRVALCMPVVPELAVGLLACARLGGVHVVLPPGTPAPLLAARLRDCGATVVVCTDHARRGAQRVPVKARVDAALAAPGGCPAVATVLVHRNTGGAVEWTPARDRWWHETVDSQPPTRPGVSVAADAPLAIVYPADEAGDGAGEAPAPGYVLSAGGFALGAAYTFRQVFQYRGTGVSFATAAPDDVFGLAYSVYGPLLCGATAVLFEGSPTYPHAGRLWQLCEKLEVRQLLAAPAIIRTLIGMGRTLPDRYDLSALRVIALGGGAVDAEVYAWADEVLGDGLCPVIQPWGAAAVGGIAIATLPGVLPQNPTDAGFPLPGFAAQLRDEAGAVVEGAGEGRLVVAAPWPAAALGTWADGALRPFPTVDVIDAGVRMRRDGRGRYGSV